MGRGARVRGGLLQANTARMARRATDAAAPNPRDLTDEPWALALERAQPGIRSEWDAFVAGGGRLPRLRELLDEDQGEDGTWRAALLVRRGRPVPVVADRFPAAVAAVMQVPGIWSGLLSVLEPGAELPEHRGPNAGVLRYHLGISCPTDTALVVDGVVVPYEEGRGVLFDDTAPHAAWNRGSVPRTTLFLEVMRPAAGVVAWANRATQEILARDPRYRAAPARAAEWDQALNLPS